MRHLPTRVLRAALLAATVGATLAACPTKQQKPDVTPCTTNAQCSGVETCVSGVCANPCGGMCASDQVCVNDACKDADGVSCAGNPSFCPAGFTCGTGQTCERQCTVDSDCPRPGFNICNPNTFVCTQCAVDDDCAMVTHAPFCDSTTGMCVGCINDMSCYVNNEPAGQYCDATTMTCMMGCTSLADCPAGTKSCEALPGSTSGAMTCVNCAVATESSDCQPPLAVCNPATLSCVACVMNTDCAETTGQCNPATNECVTCVENSVCPAGQICDLTTFECEDGCVGGSGGANCGPEAVCNPSEGPNGTCVACLQDSDCPADNICGTTSNGIPACVPGCHTDDQCNPTVTNQVCNPSDGPNGTCVDCVRDSQCPSGMVCDQTTFMCRCHETGEDCSQDSDCGYRLVPAADGGMTGICDSQEGRCIDQVQCGPEGESVTTQIRPTCTLIAQGLADQCTPAQGNCPTNWVVELAAGSSGVFAKVCVPSQDECLAPYCGN